MKVTQYIKVEKKNIGKLRTLPCVRDVEQKNGSVTCYLHSESTNGLQMAREGEYIVQFTTGMWQRFGANAFLALAFNSSEDS